MSKLNQVVAVVATKKSDAEKAITEIYHKVQKPDLFSGLTKTYETIDVEGEELPSERKLLQMKVADCLSSFESAVSPMFDTVLTQETANTRAKADIEVNGVKVLSNVPVTYLLFLEKKLTDLHTFIAKLPVLDPGKQWGYDKNADCYITPEAWKYHTKKLPRALVKSPATDKHPAQVELVHEDKNVGKWKTIEQSGAIPAREQHDMLGRVKSLLEGVKKARESANLLDVENQTCSKNIFEFILGRK